MSNINNCDYKKSDVLMRPVEFLEVCSDDKFYDVYFDGKLLYEMHRGTTVRKQIEDGYVCGPKYKIVLWGYRDESGKLPESKNLWIA